MTYRERRMRRADRLRDWADSRARKAESASKAAHAIVDHIPLGQPILVGHHSEGRHRRDIDRAESNFAKAHESRQMAGTHASKADEIERQADNAIYSDDPDAIEQLEARITDLEAERDRCKYINTVIRKGPGWAERIDPPLTEHETRDLELTAKFSPAYANESAGPGMRKPFKGYPAYHLSNLSGNLKRQRDRLAKLRR
ncbi:hypothetical protein LCGC14_0736030 [marine sediment metagenome]|uniref:DUF3560 domain-containing protein n=1 Tax=marine sediment metagenome TaxID=412755 RepID=A0A0F9ST10_9ZZZZ